MKEGGKYREYYRAIDYIFGWMKEELVGPVEDDETLENQKPLEAYACGILWPKSKKGKGGLSADEDDAGSETANDEREVHEQEEAGEAAYAEEIEVEDFTEDIMSNALVVRPSTMGITLMLSVDADDVVADFSFGMYMHSVELKEREDGSEYNNHLYKRSAHSVELRFDFSEDDTVVSPLNGGEIEKFGIKVRATKRLDLSGGERLVTFSVTNERESTGSDASINENSLYQCRLELRAESGRFVPLNTGRAPQGDMDDAVSEMQYKDVLNFAQGHGCATGWEETDGKCLKIWSDFMPKQEVRQMKPRGEKEGDIFSIRYLYTAGRGEIVDGLKRFLSSYDEWYRGQGELSETPEYRGFADAAKKCLGDIRVCMDRIEQGIRVLSENDTAWRAFVLANKAMYYQRVSMALMRDGDVNSEEEFVRKEGDPRWYPFQLFYLVMIIPDIAEENGDYRDTVDLLWFPTGGGKTEAYMAVSAFVIFFERLSDRREHYGTTVIMRYTLRLLTIQQFERASALICACDRVREEEGLGGDSISIGLWIGSDSTPNSIKEAEESLKSLRDGKNVKSNPVQITHCPYCGNELNALNYDTSEGHMKITCHECGRRLPIYIVDEDIYTFMPTLIVSTVDKFAMITWKEETGRLFGCDKAANVNKPKLIIQDELHLISDSLGTLTGLYESAVDRLCWDENGLRPKIIASTATAKNAGSQIKGLYDRDCFQFPPSGLTYSDSFFAQEATGDEMPSRYYVGLSNQGGSIMGLMVRVYAVLIVSGYYLSKMPDMPKEVVDEYYTIIGYFNSIRELGTVSSVLRERIQNNVKSLLNGKFAEWSDKLGIDKSEGGKYIYTPGRLQNDELTSRKNATEVVKTLNDLQIRYSANPLDEKPYNYVLCSNMFSVGVDISRLGLMAMYSQPKGNSDYIQATSRVGRKAPGLVFCMYSAVRTRDRSYYEQFKQYHGSFYKYVEPKSVTPFSSRSMEKGLHSVFVALVRHLVPGMDSNDSARKFDGNGEKVKEIRKYILERVGHICGRSSGDAETYLDGFIRHWERETNSNLVYDSTKKGNQAGNFTSLLVSADKEDADYPVLMSLRNVEQGCGVYVKTGG